MDVENALSSVLDDVLHAESILGGLHRLRDSLVAHNELTAQLQKLETAKITLTSDIERLKIEKHNAENFDGSSVVRAGEAGALLLAMQAYAPVSTQAWELRRLYLRARGWSKTDPPGWHWSCPGEPRTALAVAFANQVLRDLEPLRTEFFASLQKRASLPEPAPSSPVEALTEPAEAAM